MTKRVAKRRTCKWCRNRFRPKGVGRPPSSCSPACRQRAYEARRRRANAPYAALRADITETMRLQRSVDLAVIDTLRRFGFTPAEMTDEQFAALEQELRLEAQFQAPSKRRPGGRIGPDKPTGG